MVMSRPQLLHQVLLQHNLSHSLQLRISRSRKEVIRRRISRLISRQEEVERISKVAVEGQIATKK